MLSSDQVLHVARLARLELTPEEVERFGGELSKVLDHIELIGQLELEDVPPTSHVIDVENALRADEPRPSMPVERALESAPDAAEGGFRVPSPGAS
ncbi:Asp-tRNA(Asn)/Glu-tRNA(Gln) amidotransferase subunit GatC [Solirubrobacter sp. CPCC 204708]|uniref:Aspartyl/glutamyl-tRNA(Asn/Gln) amidotransferase subunit C n=1 Tax=Solirubrobacter deserti TaxID=2282478 RepID=A0ABT4RMY9_9ACTN|nr:Asp-tRNA(Asn)/Glu-tRNA(Gln) amidotransferase subunit GatC [Solirubrobacter deserti]MBE2315008.1 Asp-tRNA(Asn)/Glu-tRNA(Gln) amidotransferase subunit GatC [Solirubrobacter deserti]MDA0139923.1 Asp-tRNA(Asn)/Glu-tRNA(Gln) amidotransferase subunit GatC [Solirubrobacter deserti]